MLFIYIYVDIKIKNTLKIGERADGGVSPACAKEQGGGVSDWVSLIICIYLHIII